MSRLDLTLRAGDSFRYLLRLQTERWIYRPIEAVSQTAPLRLSVPGHGLSPGWPVALSGIPGLPPRAQPMDPPLDGECWPAEVLSADLLEINPLNASDWPAYGGGGVLQYREPYVLSGCRAQMWLRPQPQAPAVLELSSANGRIGVDALNQWLRLQLDPASTARLTAPHYVYGLALLTADGEVCTVAQGRVFVLPDCNPEDTP